MNRRLENVETLKKREIQFKGRRKGNNPNSINSNNNSTINTSYGKCKLNIKR